MSRCFPFPPPGYEKRPRSGEHGDLLAKEKHKEKKHKKEKDKERKDKDKSKDKHKEKKERKEKHKDQKKDKDRDKERDKASEDQRTEIHHKTNEFRDSKFTEELGRRIRHEEQGATNRMVEDISATPNRTIESMGTSTSMVNKTPTNVTVTIQRNEKLTPSFHNRTEIMEISMSTEKQKATNSQKVHDITSTERRRNEYVIPQLHKKTETMEKQRAANSGKVGHFTNLVAKTESMFSVNSIQSKRVTGNNLVSNTIGSSTNRNDHTMENLTSIPRRIESAGAEPAMEKERFVFPNVTGTEKKTEGKEKSKEKRAEDDKREGHKDRERKEKKRKKEKDKNRDKEKKKEEKKKGKREHRHSKHDKLKENEVKDQIPNLNNKTLAPHAENVNASGADGPNKRKKEFEGNPDRSDGPNNKRKEFKMNGFLRESQHDGRPNKLPRTSVASFHHPVENGRPTEFASGNPAGSDGPNNKRKEFEMNGFLHESQHDGQLSKLPRTSVASFHHPVENVRPTEFASGNPDGSDGPNNKRKEFEMNGFLHESQHDGRPSKLPRTSVTSFHHPVENGRPTEFASGNPDGSDGPNNKRKEFEMNGFLHESQHDGRPSKLPRTSVASFHRPAENGRPMEFASGNPDGSDGPNNKRKEFEMNGFLHESQHPIENGRPAESAPIKLRGINNTKVERGLDNNGKYINGKVEVQPSPLPKPPIPPVVKPSRPPHPDTKYLSTIYTVPKMEDLLEPDDLEWLFNGKKPPATKVEADGTPPRVGATGLQIESADVFALPYVIPL